MKSKFLILMLFLVNLVIGQSYILDNTYGTQGYKFNANYLLYPKGLLKLNQSYFYFSTNEISKTDYNGNLDASFGVNSKLSFGSSTETYTINGGKIINNFIYLFGKIVNTNNSTEDGFILKINENGIFDTTFGLNGISKINLGENENIFDFSIDNSGKLFCTAKKTGNNSSRIITFKLLSNGLIEASFGTNSFKEHIFNSLAQSGADVSNIIKVSDGYLLIGKTMHTEVVSNSTYFNSNIAIAKIDENGNYVTSFATNGIKLIHLSTSLNLYSIKDSQLINSNLYLNLFEAFSTISQFRYIKKIDITNFQTIFDVPIYYESNFKIDANENIYVVGINRCNSGPCIRAFMLKKFDSSGNVDSSFAQNGSYTYSLPALSTMDNQSSVVNLEEDDKIVIGGYVLRDYFDANNVYVSPKYGLGSIRIEQGVLSKDAFSSNSNFILYPNPSEETIYINNKKLKPIDAISIYDSMGKMVFETNKSLNEINIKEWQRGIYFIKINSNNERFHYKFIKK